MYRVWYRADGTVGYTNIVRDEPAVIARVWARLQDAHGAVSYEDMTEAEFLAMFPRDAEGRPDTSQGARWRRNPNGRGFVVDETVPAVPTLAEEIDAAGSLDDLKSILKRRLVR